MAWLTGSAGAGKSAVAQTVAEELEKEGLVIIAHFFSRFANKADRVNGLCMVPNIIYQALCAFPDIRQHVEQCIRDNHGIFDLPPADLLRKLFITQLRGHAQPKKFSFRRAFKEFFGIVGKQ